MVQPPLTTCPHARTWTQVLTPFCFCLTGHLCLEVSQVYFFNYSSRGDIDKCEGDGVGSEEREDLFPHREQLDRRTPTDMGKMEVEQMGGWEGVGPMVWMKKRSVLGAPEIARETGRAVELCLWV